MDLIHAVRALGLSWDFTRDDVLKAYKRRMLESHPDKNQDPASTSRAQLINEARDYLLGRTTISDFERREAKKRSEEQEAAMNIKKVRDWMEEMETATEEAKEEFKAWFRATNEAYCCFPLKSDQWFHVACEYYDTIKSLQRRERYNANLKKKRKEGSRAHRKTSGYNKAMLPQIAKFLQENISASAGSRLLASDIHKRFGEARKDASALELRLFNRHYKRLLLGQFPGAFYCRFKLQRSFAEVALK